MHDNQIHGGGSSGNWGSGSSAAMPAPVAPPMPQNKPYSAEFSDALKAAVQKDAALAGKIWKPLGVSESAFAGFQRWAGPLGHDLAATREAHRTGPNDLFSHPLTQLAYRSFLQGVYSVSTYPEGPEMPPLAPGEFAADLRAVMCELEQMLIEKNRKYGDSALRPAHVFSQLDPVAGLRVRIDDEISRIQNRQADDAEDAERDLLGYLVLLEIAKRRAAK